jgi:hypothetical protein
MNFRRYSSAVSRRALRELCLGERHATTASLTWDLRKGRGSSSAPGLGSGLDEAGFGARGNLAGKLYSVTHGLF